MESMQSRVQDAITGLISTLDKEHFRKMQAKMYKCSTACCENDYYGMEDVQNCVDTCAQPVTQMQKYMQHELKNYQERLQRCAMDCSDKSRDKVGSGSTDADMAKYRHEMEQCAVRCGSDHIALIPAMMKRMKETLKTHEK